MGISRTTAHKWVRRWRVEGDAGLYDRSSRPLTTPHRTPANVENRICELRRDRKLGPARIGPILGIPASTVHRVLTRHGLNRLSWMDRPTGQVIRRYERERPGELVHVDIKKLGNIPDGGGHRIMPRQQALANRQATPGIRKGGRPVIGWFLLPVRAVRQNAERGRHHPQTHRPLPSADQRQGRAPESHPGRGMGVRAPVLQYRRTH
jgi:hypothetical protein